MNRIANVVSIWVNVVRCVHCFIWIWFVYGGISPLFLEPVNENRAPSPAKEVFSAIFTDLKYAIENIPGDAYPKADYTKNDGHITKYAAEACWHVPIFSIPDITVKNL